MRNTTSSSSASAHLRILLCASAAHCAQVLQAAAQMRVNLHGLQPCTTWPAHATADHLVLWALLPATPHAAPEAPAWQTEQLWRKQLWQGSNSCTVHMLYGSPLQQAQQLTPWMAGAAGADSGAETHAARAPCMECVDAASEQKLFQHLLKAQ